MALSTSGVSDELARMMDGTPRAMLLISAVLHRTKYEQWRLGKSRTMVIIDGSLLFGLAAVL